MKLQLWGHHFQDFPDIQETLLTTLPAVPEGQFQLCF
jgi:hypothetical protein